MEKGLLDDKPIARRLHKALIQVNNSNAFTGIEAGKDFAQKAFLAVVDLEATSNRMKTKISELQGEISSINKR